MSIFHRKTAEEKKKIRAAHAFNRVAKIIYGLEKMRNEPDSTFDFSVKKDKMGYTYITTNIPVSTQRADGVVHVRTLVNSQGFGHIAVGGETVYGRRAASSRLFDINACGAARRALKELKKYKSAKGMAPRG